MLGATRSIRLGRQCAMLGSNCNLASSRVSDLFTLRCKSCSMEKGVLLSLFNCSAAKCFLMHTWRMNLSTASVKSRFLGLREGGQI